MPDLPKMTDRRSLELNRERARRLEGDPFLYRIASHEIEERLNLVNRRFTKPAIVTGFPHLWPDWQDQARIVPDDETLDLDLGAHDLVLHVMGLHWSNDPVGQIVQCRRALVPDGLFLAVIPGGRTLHELRRALAEAEVELTGGLSPRVLPMADIRDLGGVLVRAGLALAVVDSLAVDVSYRDIRHLAQDLRVMGEGNSLAARSRRFQRNLFDLAEKHYFQAHATPDGRLSATFELMVLTGWAPDASQPQPLKPGSAAMRLADALKGVSGGG